MVEASSLGALASRFIETESVPWIETTPGMGRIIEVTSSSRWASLLPTTSARMSKPPAVITT